MPLLSTKVDLCKGHDGCPPRAFAAYNYSSNVFAEGFEVAREGDSLHPHGCPKHPPHAAKVTAGYPSVTVNGKRVAYVGACVDCASQIVNTGRPSVKLGEGSGGGTGSSSVSARGTDENADDGGNEKPVRGGQSAQVAGKIDKGGRQCRGRTQYTQETPATCGMSSARMVINELTNNNVSEQQVARTANGLDIVDSSGTNWGPVYASGQGTMVEGLPGTMAAYGVESYSEPAPQPATAADINRMTANGTRPAIVMVKSTVTRGGAHIVVVDGVDDNGNVLVRDPGKRGAAGCRQLTMSEYNNSIFPGSSVVIVNKPPAGYQTPVTTRARTRRRR
jgi:uncharacterized Zn-binding protein involved in type VI secretion/predicted double-glycine peptidase